MVHTGYVELRTRGNTDFHDLTDPVHKVVGESGVANGIVTVFSSSSTSSLTTIEYESGALEDLRRALEAIAPSNGEYRHNLRWGDGNGHSHLRAALLGPSLSVPVVDGQLALGTWQQILFIDFDVRGRSRKIIIQVSGDPSGMRDR
jgi:secondary thiamine-phosphate synthase enzyme